MLGRFAAGACFRELAFCFVFSRFALKRSRAHGAASVLVLQRSDTLTLLRGWGLGLGSLAVGLGGFVFSGA